MCKSPAGRDWHVFLYVFTAGPFFFYHQGLILCMGHGYIAFNPIFFYFTFKGGKIRNVINVS